MSTSESREEVRRSLYPLLRGVEFPEAPPLNLNVLWRRTFLDYEEWKIEYDVETAETMPAPAGRRVPAYLLIPRDHVKPMPAMACLHQCGIDCTVAKEAVVGKAPWVEIRGAPTEDWTFSNTSRRITIDRSDQAYGYELVHEGFVGLESLDFVDSQQIGRKGDPCGHIGCPHVVDGKWSVDGHREDGASTDNGQDGAARTGQKSR